eukprot:1511163-Rhodomonas_salina.3
MPRTGPTSGPRSTPYCSIPSTIQNPNGIRTLLNPADRISSISDLVTHVSRQSVTCFARSVARRHARRQYESTARAYLPTRSQVLLRETVRFGSTGHPVFRTIIRFVSTGCRVGQ